MKNNPFKSGLKKYLYQSMFKSQESLQKSVNNKTESVKEIKIVDPAKLMAKNLQQELIYRAVVIENSSGKALKVNAIIDSGAQVSCICPELREKLNLQKIKVANQNNIEFAGLNNQKLKAEFVKANICIRTSEGLIDFVDYPFIVADVAGKDIIMGLDMIRLMKKLQN